MEVSGQHLQILDELGGHRDSGEEEEAVGVGLRHPEARVEPADAVDVDVATT